MLKRSIFAMGVVPTLSGPRDEETVLVQLITRPTTNSHPRPQLALFITFSCLRMLGFPCFPRIAISTQKLGGASNLEFQKIDFSPKEHPWTSPIANGLHKRNLSHGMARKKLAEGWEMTSSRDGEAGRGRATSPSNGKKLRTHRYPPVVSPTLLVVLGVHHHVLPISKATSCPAACKTNPHHWL